VECRIGADSDTRDGAVGGDDNRSDGVDVIFDLHRKHLLVELVLLKTAHLCQPGVSRTRTCEEVTYINHVYKL